MTREIEIFLERCGARAILWSSAMMDLHEAVDGLQAAAERAGIVDDIGQDAIQKFMSDAFRQRREMQC